MEASDGTKYWGKFGAAGLLAHDRDRGVLLQHRVSWSHHGGTWGLPGGALHHGENACAGALREAHEEAAVPIDAVRPEFCSVLNLKVWSYTTVVATVVKPFEPEITDPESEALEWVPVDEVADRPLHPGFAQAWPTLRTGLGVRPVVIVDVANVMGSVPDGWWKDRAGAASRLAARVARLADRGVAADRLGLPGTTWWPRFDVVVEGKARAIPAPPDAPRVQIVRAPRVGDDQIVETAEVDLDAGELVIVVTSDRGLRERITAVGGKIQGTRWLLDQLD